MNPERGSVMLIVAVVLVAAVGVSGVTLLSVRGGVRAAAHDRSTNVALYAAESGVAAAMQFLRESYVLGDAADNWSALVEPNNEDVSPNPGIVGNTKKIGEAGNLFSGDTRAWYEVLILNNTDDPGYAAGNDTDSSVILRATGHGPGGAVAIIEVQIAPSSAGEGVPCDGYRQKAMDALGTGFNPCQEEVNAGDVAELQLE